MANFPWAYLAMPSVVSIVLLLPASVAVASCGTLSGAPREEAAHAGTVALRPVRNVMMGTNLDGLAYWNTGLPMLDLMKSAGRWLPQNAHEYDTGEPLPLDAEGWVIRVGPSGGAQRHDSVLVNVLHDNPAAPPGMRYVVLYDGSGIVSAVPVDGARTISQVPGRLVVAAGNAGSLYLRVAAGADGVPATVRNIRVVREDRLALYQAGLTFNPDFLDRIDDFQVLRFMDWMNTNAVLDRSGRPLAGDGVDAAPLLAWDDRPKPGDMRWGDGSAGVPVEAMVELANRAGAEPWFNMPVNAGDEYVREFARYVRDHLRPDLRVHVEFSNEVWNTIFPQARYARGRARAVFGPEGDWMEWYGMRAAQIGCIWNDIFGESVTHRGDPGRVLVVYNTQFAWKGLEANGLDTVHWRDAAGAHVRASDYFDEYAITGYYDGAMNTDAAAPAVEAWWRDPDGGYRRAIAALRDRIVEFNVPLYRYHAGQAARRDLQLVTYESGFGEYTPVSRHQQQAYTDFLAKLQARPEIFDLETANYQAFRDAGGALYMNFGIIGMPSKWGSWSALERVDQATSPRYRALIAWLAANPAEPDRGRAFADARIYRGGDAGETIRGSAHGYDVLVGGAGADRFVPGGGPDSRIEGGEGEDILVLSSRPERYRFSQEGSGQVRVSGPDGTQVVTGVEQVSFAGGQPVSLAAAAGRLMATR